MKPLTDEIRQETGPTKIKHYDLALDFDGVIHSYVSGFQGVAVLPDPPVPGAITWLTELLQRPRRTRLRVVIFTTRMQVAKDEPNVYPYTVAEAIYAYLVEHGLPSELTSRLDIALAKPSAKVYVDDRGYRFNGTFPDADELMALEPWNKTDRS